uniref:BACK domain-containing protein n=1 Tax=Romanomermis culicivorax TaxID=13658 RepID=A0A915JFX7_ROMCU
MIIAAESQEFLQLTVRDLYKLLSNDRLNVCNEANLWHAMKRWHDHDPINRANHIGRLIKTIRLALCSHNVLEEISCDPLITNNEDCRRWIGGAYKLVYGFDNHISDSQMYELTAYKVWSPRIPSQVILAVGGWSGGSASGIIECYDQRADEWHEVSFPDPAGARAYHSCIIVNHSLFVAGGFTGQLPFNSVRTFDLKTKHWRDRASMNFRRCYLSMACCKGLIWALGGFDGTRRLNTAECYSHTDNHWTVVRSMTNRRSDAHAVTVDDQIYVVGGFDGADCLDTVERLHCGENNWTFAPSMSKKRSGVGAVFCQGSMQAFNFLTPLVVLMVIGVKKRLKDTTREPAVGKTCVTCLYPEIYVIGGFNGHTTVSTVDVYDCRSDRWESAASLSLHRSALYCCLLSDEEYINSEFVRMPRLFPAQKLKSMQERLTAAESAAAAAAAQNAVSSPTRTKVVKNSHLIQQQEVDDPELDEDSEVD